jgi:hypothetical protein
MFRKPFEPGALSAKNEQTAKGQPEAVFSWIF